MTTDRIRLTFHGEALETTQGKSVAAALTDAGHRVFRETVTAEMRGMFCGMGVCQDCLVTVDGVPNQRACMTPARDNMEIARQAALADHSQVKVLPSPGPREIAPDVLVIGGGAGGLSAATAAAKAGASVVLLDERKVAGGQYFKQTAIAACALDAQQEQGRALIEAAHQAGVKIVQGAEVWGVFDGPVIMAAQSDGAALVARPEKLIIATGAYERPVMVPGWTLPGVMTTGAGQTLWRSYRSLAGKRVAICGTGPLNLQVAAELAAGGAKVVLVAEAAPSPLRNLFAATLMALCGPRLAVKGLAMLASLKRKRVPIQFETNLVRIEKSDGLRAVFVDRAGQEGAYEVDAVCMNAGFEPQNEALRLLGGSMQYDAEFGHLRCERRENMATTVANVYAVGDCAGLGGAPAAMVEGRIAGASAAAECGFGESDQRADLRLLAKHRRFQHYLWKLYRSAPVSVSGASDDMIVCRCEQVTLGELKASFTDAPKHLGTVKRATRLGMGRCQGRYCGPVAVRLLAETTEVPIEDFSHFAPRVPIKPVAIAAVVGASFEAP